MRYLFIVLLITQLPGCANFTTLDSPETAARLDDLTLCARYHSNLCGGIYGCPEDQIAINEIRKRNLIAEDEWRLINERKIAIGMSECSLRASWGPHFGINTTATRYGVINDNYFSG